MFALAFLLLCSAAHADLYRWVDPESGSVKLSNTPPPWYERGVGPAVERIPYSAPGARSPAADPSRADSGHGAADPAGTRRRQDEAARILRRVQK